MGEAMHEPTSVQFARGKEAARGERSDWVSHRKVGYIYVSDVLHSVQGWAPSQTGKQKHWKPARKMEPSAGGQPLQTSVYMPVSDVCGNPYDCLTALSVFLKMHCISNEDIPIVLHYSVGLTLARPSPICLRQTTAFVRDSVGQLVGHCSLSSNSTAEAPGSERWVTGEHGVCVFRGGGQGLDFVLALKAGVI